jgi:hypothetical protein
MAIYSDGKAALADARLRVDGMKRDQGILMVEGRDDLLVFSSRVLSLQSVVACGNKSKLRDALHSSTSADRSRILFVADCDYDVPAGTLQPVDGLVLTQHTDRETDFVQLGVVKAAVLRSIPRARASDEVAEAITTDVLNKATILAEALGRLRYVSSVDNLGLDFDDLELRRFRRKQDGVVDGSKLIRSVVQRSPRTRIEPAGLEQRALDTPDGLEVCQGKDLVQAVTAVIHQDYGVSLKALGFVPELFRLVEDRIFEAWKVVDRVRAWEEQGGVRLLG